MSDHEVFGPQHWDVRLRLSERIHLTLVFDERIFDVLYRCDEAESLLRDVSGLPCLLSRFLSFSHSSPSVSLSFLFCHSPEAEREIKQHESCQRGALAEQDPAVTLSQCLDLFTTTEQLGA